MDKTARQKRQKEYNKKWKKDHPNYNRERYKENLGQVKEYNRKWMKEHPNYSREWYEKNLERVKETSRKWHEKNPEFSRNWRKENPEKVKESSRNWRKENPEKAKESSRKWRKENPEFSRNWRKENSERIKEYARNWYKENREESKEYDRNWYKENREEIRKYYEEHREERQEYDRKYYAEHREEIRKYGREYYKKHPEDAREWTENWKRNHPDTTVQRYYGVLRLKTGQCVVGATKRSYPISGACELCGKIPEKEARRQLIYHHWTDAKTEWGLWICGSGGRYSCHGIAELSDFYPDVLSLRAKYLALKKLDRSKEKRSERIVSLKTGKTVRRFARIYPATDRCALCGRMREERRPKRKLVYHHWTDDDPMQALWLCGFAFRCHDIAEICEQFPELFALSPKYLKLKKKIEAPALIAGKNEKEI